MVAPTKTISSLDPLGSLAQLGRTGMIRSLTTFYPDARREHRPASTQTLSAPYQKLGWPPISEISCVQLRDVPDQSSRGRASFRKKVNFA
jgi:hypothetical protein